MAKFRKGQSGNPAGRAKGSRNRVTLLADELFDEKLFGADNKAAALIDKAIALAEGGDTTCMRLCFERLAPPRRDRPVPFELPKMTEPRDAVNVAAVVVAAVAKGELTPSEASELCKVIDSYARVLQVADFDARLAKLEKAVAQ